MRDRGRDEGTRVQEKKLLGERTRNNSTGLEQRPSWAEGTFVSALILLHHHATLLSGTGLMT